MLSYPDVAADYIKVRTHIFFSGYIKREREVLDQSSKRDVTLAPSEHIKSLPGYVAASLQRKPLGLELEKFK